MVSGVAEALTASALSEQISPQLGSADFGVVDGADSAAAGHGAAWSVAMVGVEATMVEVEAAIGSGLPRTVLVGLPDTALHEAKDRCRAAFAGANLAWPDKLLTINLTPASLPKAGTHYDLAIIAAILIAAKIVPSHLGEKSCLMGEVGLDAKVRPVAGILPGLIAAAQAGFDTAIVPASQIDQANLISGLTIWPVGSVADLVQVLSGNPVSGGSTELSAGSSGNRHSKQSAGRATDTKVFGSKTSDNQPVAQPDFADVAGQANAKWALEVAAAGRHHVFLHGAPGLGKTMLAERLPSILPQLSEVESLEVSALYSLAGDSLSQGLITRPPFKNPHHSASLAALIGGGTKISKPGAVSLAHRGVLFLDEAPEFDRRVLEALRTTLECGWVEISRSQMSAKYPADFQLILAANPCPCGFSNSVKQTCKCTPNQIRRYRNKISGPILDRIDINVELVALSDTIFAHKATSVESSKTIRERVIEARQRAEKRLSAYGYKTNGQVSSAVLRKQLPAPTETKLLTQAYQRGKISSRAIDKIVRLGWTLADLAGRDRICEADLGSAMMLKMGQW